ARTTFARIHDVTFRDNSVINHQSHFGIDHLINPEALAAVELAKRIRNPGRVAVEDFGRGQIEVKKVIVQKGATIIGKPLHEQKLPGNIRVGLIFREGKTIVAKANSVLHAGDEVTLFGHPDSIFESQALFDPTSKGSQKISVTLLTGSEISISLIRLLNNPRFKLRIIERDLATCKKLSVTHPQVTIIHGEGTSLRVLEEEEVGESDFFVACSKDDEDNIMTCLQAHKLGARRTLLAINRADYLEILDKLKDSLGVDLAVSPRIAATNEILRYIGKKPYMEVGDQGDETTTLIEARVGPNSTVIGKSLREIPLPDECVIVGLEHNYRPKMPTGDDVLHAGDSLIAVIGKEQMKSFLKLIR
ncbi:MAG: Trk system potassium transporter TrkA, partial [Verrucomicrobiota bacterium]